MTDLLITNAALLDVEAGTVHTTPRCGSPETGSVRSRPNAASTSAGAMRSSTLPGRR